MASGSGDGSDESALDPVWRKLPVELVEFVLKRVPFESLVRFRAVCKRFKSLITSPKFARECQRQQARKPVPVVVQTCILFDSSVKVFNTETNNWLTCPLPIFDKRLYPLEVTASSGGLICFETWGNLKFNSLGFQTFVVYNLMTGAFRLVELTPGEGDICPVRSFTSLLVDLQGGTFTLVVVTTSDNEAGRKTFLYDSADGSWKSGAPLPDMECFADHMISFDIVTSNGNIYGLLKSFLYTFTTVLKYDVRSNKWSEISLANVVYGSCNSLEILEHRCEVIFVSSSAMDYWWLDNDIQIHYQKFFYRVRETTASHGETLLVEDRAVFQVLRKNEWITVISHMSDVATFGLGDVICFTKSKGPDSLRRLLHFNCSNQNFSFLPEYPMESSEWPEFQLKLVEPSLTVDL